jgi:di/tripeptidase
MSDFVIDPPIRILGRRGSFVRSTKEAAAFMREHMDVNAAPVLKRLEGVMSVKEAQEAAKAFRSWIANREAATSEGVSKTNQRSSTLRASHGSQPDPNRLFSPAAGRSASPWGKPEMF